MWPTHIFFSWFGLRAQNLAHHSSTQFPICYTLSFKHLTVYSLSHLLYSQLLTKYKEDPPQTNLPSVWGGSCGEIYSFHQYPPPLPLASRLP